MKKLLLILISLSVFACSKDDDNQPEAVQNPFEDTQWISYDPILAILYGPSSTRTMEFLANNVCIETVYKASGPLAGTDVTQGTYTYVGNDITWFVDGDDTTATRYGSVLETTIVIDGNPILFQLID